MVVAICNDKFDKLRTIFNLTKDEVSEILSPRFYTYFSKIFEDPTIINNIIDIRNHMFNLTNAKDKMVLDFGCGLGLNSIVFSILGAKKVIALDDNKEYIETVKKLANLLSISYGNIEPVFSKNGLSLFNDRTFDVIIMQEVVSHMSQNILTDVLYDVYRVLSIDGNFLIEDSNNKLQLPFLSEMKSRKNTRIIAERGEVSNHQLGIKESYREMRENIIRSRFPSLADEDIKYYAKITQGMMKDEIVSCINQLLKTGKNIIKPSYMFIDPINGHAFEVEINPFKLMRQLKGLGFRSKLIPPDVKYVFRENESVFKNILKKILHKTIKHPKIFFNPILLFFDKNVRILAKKG